VHTAIKFRYILASSVLVALLAVIGPRYLRPDVDLMLQCNLALVALWAVILVVSIFWYRWRALWLLLGAPLLAYWPVGFWLLERACAQDSNNCP
jgi:hypothetical protein